MALTRKKIRDAQDILFGFASEPQPIAPQTPANISATGRKLNFQVVWSRVRGVDGYRVAIMSVNNLADPDFIKTVPGEQDLEYVWVVGDVAITRQFAVQSFKSGQSSEFSGLVEATSVVDGGASDSAPAAPPDQSTLTPETIETIPDPGDIPQP